MYELSTIKETVTQVAEAITTILNIDTEIVDHKLMIVSGTGRYRKKVGGYEENGDLNSPYIYGTLIRTGSEYVCLDTSKDPKYHPVEGELAEISCPILIDDDIIGIIGLIAFTPEQQSKIQTNEFIYLNFLRHMSELISSKLIESQSSTKLATLLESMPDGLIATDTDGTIFACNYTAELFLRHPRGEIIGKRMEDLFTGEDFFSYLNENKAFFSRDIIMPGNDSQRFYCTKVPIPQVGTMYLFEDASSAVRLIQDSYLDQTTSFNDIVGSSPKLMDIKRKAMQVSDNDSTILITGESGTGKELFARAIHNYSRRSAYPFLSINCGAIPDSLLESELFGYEKGAFTGASTHGKLGKLELGNHGTIFLDEIGDMPLHMQVKLLHFLQSRTIERVGGIQSIPVDVRIIAATNRPLEDMIRKKEFREDLYFRLSVIPFQIPPLRERAEDIVPLLNSSIKRFSSLMDKDIQGFSPEAMSLLMGYSWPGNIRELENTVEYCINVAPGSIITEDHLPKRIRDEHAEDPSSILSEKSPGKNGGLKLGHGPLKRQVEAAERVIISRTLQETGSSLSGKRRAAKILDISESTLYRKIRELGID